MRDATGAIAGVLVAGLVAGAPAGAEELLIQGMGRTLGWTIAAADGELAFRTCAGERLRAGRTARTSKRCRGASAGAERVVGVVRRVDRDREIVLVERAGGTVDPFYYGRARRDEEPRPAQRVVVVAPVPGHAAAIEAP